MNKNYSKILSQIKFIRENDPEFKVFGSYRWSYTYKPVTDSDIDYVEKKHQIELPNDFKEFILHVGFGAGPSYGVNLDTFLEVDKYEIECEDDEFNKPLDNGYIVVSEHGCGIETVLIIDGKHKGEIWQINDFGVQKYADNYYEWYTKWLNVIVEVLNNEEGERITLITSNF
ncbi:MAG: SMI1/KNR4 family protein [Winogradskyella sp.]|nr:SMI1/KNR4 family protein [Winogradskyella sp.]